MWQADSGQEQQTDKTDDDCRCDAVADEEGNNSYQQKANFVEAHPQSKVDRVEKRQ